MLCAEGRTGMKPHILSISHNHGNVSITSECQFDAEDEESALLRGRFWIRRNKNENNCERYGNNCKIDARAANPLQAFGFLPSPEKIGISSKK